MAIVQAYKCPCCGNFYDIKNKHKYVDHLKKHARKKLDFRKIQKKCEKSETLVDSLFDGVNSLMEFIRLSLTHFPEMVKYKYQKQLLGSISALIKEQHSSNLQNYVNNCEIENSFTLDDVYFTFHEDVHKRTIDGVTLSDVGIAVRLKCKGTGKLPTAFNGLKRKYVTINNFRYYVYNKITTDIIMFILLDPNDHKSIATAKLISD